jgi:hypothetical protein
MPTQKAVNKARKAKRAGKAVTTQAGAFVHEEIRKIRRGKHGARSSEQAIAIGLSEARRAGVKLPPPRKGSVKKKTRRSAENAYQVGQRKRKPKHQPRVARAVSRTTMKQEPRAAASRKALSRHAKKVASRSRMSKQAAGPKKTYRPAKASASSRSTRRTRRRRIE